MWYYSGSMYNEGVLICPFSGIVAALEASYQRGRGLGLKIEPGGRSAQNERRAQIVRKAW